MAAPWAALEWMGEATRAAPLPPPREGRPKGAKKRQRPEEARTTTPPRAGGLAQGLARAVMENLAALNEVPMEADAEALVEDAIKRGAEALGGDEIVSGSEVADEDPAEPAKTAKRPRRGQTREDKDDDSEDPAAHKAEVERARKRIAIAAKTHELVAVYRSKLERDLETMYRILGVPPLTPSSSHRQQGSQLGPPPTLEDLERYCVCKQLFLGSMIACDSETCPVEWFHCECAGIPPGEDPPNFVCHICLAHRASAGKKDVL